MRSNFTKAARSLLLLLALLAGNSVYAATQFRSYLSVNGLDTNPCTTSAPCRLLPAALAVTTAGGEVWMLDSGNYNSGVITVTQSVTIVAAPGALASLTASGGDVIDVPTDNVSLTVKNLLISSPNGGYIGMFATGANVQMNVEGSEFNGLNIGFFMASAGGHASVEKTTFRNTQYGVYFNSTSTTVFSQGTVDHCTLIGKGVDQGVYATNAMVTVTNSTLSNHMNAVYATTNAQVVLDANRIVQNTYGVSIQNSAIVETHGTNVFKFNSADTIGARLTIGSNK